MRRSLLTEWRGSNQCSQSQRGGNTPAAEPRAASGPCQQTANDSTEDKRHPGLTPVTARTGWERRLAYHTSTHTSTSTDGPTTVPSGRHAHRRTIPITDAHPRSTGGSGVHPVHILTPRGGEGGSLFVPMAQLKEPLPRPDLGSRQRHRRLAFDGGRGGALAAARRVPLQPCLMRLVHLPYTARAPALRGTCMVLPEFDRFDMQ